MSRASSKRRRNAGSAALEFALVAGPFLVLFLAVTDLGRYFAVQQQLHTVTANAARACMVRLMGGATECDNIRTAVESTVPLLSPGLLSVDVGSVSPADADGTTTFTVNSSYRFTFVIPIWASASTSRLTTSTTVKF